PRAAPRFGRAAAPLWVTMNSPTAVPRLIYRRYATAFAAAGFGVLTYDYRGIGGSRPASLRGFHAKTRDWVLKDMSAVVAWARAHGANRRLFLVGHSVGGQLAGMIDDPDAVDAMVTFSSQSGYFALQGAEQKAVVWFHSHVTLPVLSHLCGYVPWRRLGAAEDLPQQCGLEWARWCRDPDYLLGDATLPLHRFSRFRAPVLAYSFADDKWGTPQAVDAMMRAYPRLERRHVAPGELGLSSIGHFGAFRRSASALWEQTIAWLRARSDARAI
ncbi:MAG: alpha/beta fold hydrolase, partial [Myxococcota bacterium]